MPAVIDRGATFLIEHTTEFIFGVRILSGIRIDERDTIEGDRNDGVRARYVFSLPVDLQHLARHVLNDEELVALVFISGIRHHDNGRVRLRVTRCIFDVEIISAQESEAVDAVVVVRQGAIRHQRSERVGVDDKRTSVIEHVERREVLLFVAEEADIFIVVVMR